jgi:hypothetical protein
LSDPTVIQLIARNFVPVALNRHEISKAKGEAGDFFRSVYLQTISTQYQGLWAVNTEGKILAVARGEGLEAGAWTKHVLTRLQAGLKQFGKVEPRHVQAKPVPYRGVGMRPDGGVTLAVFDRSIPAGGLSRQLHPSEIGELFIGSVPLSASDWSALAPPLTQVGARWTIPENVAREFWRLLSARDAEFIRADEVQNVEFSGRVTAVRDGTLHLTYAGQIAGTHSGNGLGWDGFEMFTKMKIVSGVGTFDLQSGQMLSLTWVMDGVYSDFYRPPYRGKPTQYGWVVEWRLKDSRAAAPVESEAVAQEAAGRTANATPEVTLKTFLLALAAGDEATLRAVALPHPQLDALLTGRKATPEQLAQLKARLDEKPIRRLKAGDPVTMPSGEARVITDADVREGRVVVWVDGEPLPTRLEMVDGQWKVFAGTFIAVRK